MSRTPDQLTAARGQRKSKLEAQALAQRSDLLRYCGQVMRLCLAVDIATLRQLRQQQGGHASLYTLTHDYTSVPLDNKGTARPALTILLSDRERTHSLKVGCEHDAGLAILDLSPEAIPDIPDEMGFEVIRPRARESWALVAGGLYRVTKDGHGKPKESIIDAELQELVANGGVSNLNLSVLGEFGELSVSLSPVIQRSLEI